MSPLNRTTSIGEVPLRCPELLIEQAFCVAVGQDKFCETDTLEELANRYEIHWEEFESRMSEIVAACRQLKVLEEAGVREGFVFNLSSDSPENPHRPSPFSMASLLQREREHRVHIQGGDEASRISAALYLVGLGFTRISYQPAKT